jgi:hypothetical protein
MTISFNFLKKKNLNIILAITAILFIAVLIIFFVYSINFLLVNANKSLSIDMNTATKVHYNLGALEELGVAGKDDISILPK